MPKTPFRTGRDLATRRKLELPTRSQVIRQVGVILVILVLWSALLAGFIRITSEPLEQTINAPLEPTVAGTERIPETETPEPTNRPTEPEASESDYEPTPSVTGSREEPSTTAVPSATLQPTEVAMGPTVSFPRRCCLSWRVAVFSVMEAIAARVACCWIAINL